VLLAAVALPGVGRAGAQTSSLSGRFAVTAGTCDGAPAGSYFRMILPTGRADGPFVSNSDSACGDKTYTLLDPGTDGGLIVGTYQSEPSPAFDGNGNSLSEHITKPTKFFGVDFSTSTNGTDPQTKASVPPPSLSAAEDGTLSGDLRSFAASWNNQEFNQGAPKPDGSTPGLTAAPSGTLDAQSGAYTLEWRSEIIGGPFDKFTGLWHLEGTFTPDTTPTTAAAVPPGADQSASANTDDPTLSASSTFSANTTSTTPLALSTAAPSSSGSGVAVAPSSTIKSPSVVIARSGGGSSGKGWVLIPVGLAAIAAGAIAYRFRVVKRRSATP
jgi:hypothetical protein